MRKVTQSTSLFSETNLEAIPSSNNVVPLDVLIPLEEDEMHHVKHVDSIPDCLLLSLNDKGKVDINYIHELSSHSEAEIINALKGSIFLNPDSFDGDLSHGWVTKDEYLSGNLADKLSKALLANKTHRGLFKDNILALQNEMLKMPKLSADDIYVTLGTPWIDPFIIKLFIRDTLETNVDVRHDNKTGSWSIVGGSRYGVKFCVQYGTKRMNAIDIISRTLNQTPIVVNKENNYFFSNKKNKPERDEKETLFALSKQNFLMETFEKWVKATPERKKYIEDKYNEKYGYNLTRHFDGSFLTMPDVNPDIHLFDYQKNAIARMILTPNTLLAHDVGSGKSYEMIGAAHEMKRIGIANKLLFVVPNNIVEQWKTMWHNLYPNCHILVIDPKKFGPKNRNEILNDIIYNDYDGIIMAYSSFELIDLSPDVLKESIKKEVESVVESYRDYKSQTTAVKRSYTAYIKGNYTKEIEELGEREPGKIYFDDLGIDHLFVDESHNFKNVPIKSNVHALGINTTGSKQSAMMMEKVHYIQRTHNGGGVVFATGTPITNSISDVYNIQRYLQEGELTVLNLQSFNAWIANFAELSQNFEIDVDTSSYRMASRYSKFHNLPELSALLANIADFHKVDIEKDIPEFKGYTDIAIDMSEDCKDFIKSISSRAELIRAKRPMEFTSIDGQTKIKDNMLLVTRDGRDAALDLRLVYKDKVIAGGGKINRCADEVSNIYFETAKDKLTQLVFCDTSTPSNSRFNVYDELRNLLVMNGVNYDEIAFIHDADTESKKKKLFKAVNDGTIRVLIGSTFKLGIGVNVQNKLVAIHHLDVPWRPSDMVQRQGRILRPGNSNKEVYIYRYITKQSFDAYSWQLLETKQNFISRLLSNNVNERRTDDIDDTVLSYAEVKALAIGNPLLKERVEVNNEINRLISLRNKQGERIAQLRSEIKYVEDNKDQWQLEIENAEHDAIYIKKNVQIESIGDQEAYLDEASKKSNVQNRKNLKEMIYSAVINNATGKDEVKITDHLGFEIYAPAYSSAYDNKFVYLKRNGKYKVLIGDSNIGVLTRINNFIKNFDAVVNGLKDRYQDNLKFAKVSRQEIKDANSYDDQIRELKTKLAVIDMKLGVKED